ncbi:MAG: FecR family protein [Gammaproteobacteria bacterium]|jgi:ferric-dicitrate binding protein FerR (iron transport regulator)
MYENDGNTADPLAEIIRAAGRRTEPPQEHRDQVFAAARLAWQRKVRARRRIPRLAVAATIAALLVTGALFQLMMNSHIVPAATIAISQGTIELRMSEAESWQDIAGTQHLAPGTHLRTRGDGGVALALAEGGSLRLNANTEIVLSNSRYELVTGTVYFDSDGRASSAPVEIVTAYGIVQDIGTQFEVATIQNVLRVRVRSGRVAVTDRGSDIDIAANAGSEIELSPGGALVQREFPPTDPAWAWVESLAIPPASHSILSYLTWVARETGNRLAFEPYYVERIAATENLMGDLDDHTPLEVLDLIVATTDFRYETTDDGTIVIHRTDVP